MHQLYELYIYDMYSITAYSVNVPSGMYALNVMPTGHHNIQKLSTGVASDVRRPEKSNTMLCVYYRCYTLFKWFGYLRVMDGVANHMLRDVERSCSSSVFVMHIMQEPFFLCPSQ